jgi:hypothetical protein
MMADLEPIGVQVDFRPHGLQENGIEDRMVQPAAADRVIDREDGCMWKGIS